MYTDFTTVLTLKRFFWIDRKKGEKNKHGKWMERGVKNMCRVEPSQLWNSWVFYVIFIPGTLLRKFARRSVFYTSLFKSE